MLFLIVFTFLGFITGYLISNVYKYKYLVYKDSKEFFEYYKLKMSFSKQKLLDIINTYSYNKKNLIIKKFLLDFYSSKKIESNKENFKIKYLNDNACCELHQFFTSLGKLGAEQEEQHINSIIKQLDKKQTELYSEYKKLSSLYIKLFTLFGLGVGVLLL